MREPQYNGLPVPRSDLAFGGRPCYACEHMFVFDDGGAHEWVT